MTISPYIHRVVLTGASGMLGRAILRQLAGRKEMAILALYRRDPPRGGPANIHVATADLGNVAEMSALLKGFKPTVLIHTAATGMQSPRPTSEILEEINTEMPVQLAEATSQIDDCSFVHVSSGLAYKDQGRPLREGDPLETGHAYGASKVEAEKHLQAAAAKLNLRLTIVRPFSFTGEGDFGTRLFPSLLRSAAAQERFQMSLGDQVRDHSSVDDIAAGITAAALKPPENQTPQVWNLGASDTRTLREVVTTVVHQLGLKLDIEFGAHPHAADEPMFMVPDTTRAQTMLNWRAQENLAHAVWRLAGQSFPSLSLNEPARFL